MNFRKGIPHGPFLVLRSSLRTDRKILAFARSQRSCSREENEVNPVKRVFLQEATVSDDHMSPTNPT